MRIIEIQLKFNNNALLETVNAKYVGDFAIRITFNDGSEKLIDFKPFLSNSHHPSIRKYLNEEKFNTFKIIGSNLNWNDHDLIFPIADLYKGLIN
jgi:hypothetical protein